jgi:sec-independent protein translocase protein TatA
MFQNFAILDLNAPELVIILLIVLLLFGGKKLPELSKSVGESLRELKKGLNGEDSDQNTKKENVKSKKTTKSKK